MKKIIVLIVFSFCTNIKAQSIDNSNDECSNEIHSNYLNDNNFSFIENKLLQFFLRKSESKNDSIIDNFLGFWSNENLVIEIYKMDDSYYGKIIVTDSSNQDMNKVILIQMKKRNNKTLYGGTYYDASIGHEYEAKIKIKDSNTLRFTGFYGFFNKINFWKRIRKNKIPKPNK